MADLSLSSGSITSSISRKTTLSSTHTTTPVQVKESKTANLTSIQFEYIPIDVTQTIAQFELDDSLPFRLSKHVIKKLSSEFTNKYTYTQIQKLSDLLIALVYIKTFKQIWSSFTFDYLTDEEAMLQEISELNIAVPERIDVLLSGLGNIQTDYGTMKLMWPVTTAKTCLVHALKYGSSYFGEKVFSRFFPPFENGYTSKLIWCDDEGYEKFGAYCLRYLNRFGPIHNASVDEMRNSIPQWFHDENPDYLIVYLANLTTKEEWFNKLNSYDLNDDVVRSLEILGLQFCTIQSTTLTTTCTRLEVSYDKFESIKFDNVFKMRRTKGTGKGCLGQLCQSIGKKSYSSAFPFTDSNRTYGYMLRPSVFYEVTNRDRAVMLFSEMVD
ncbi:hypothetical protein Cantr_00516 [Candida viswanathii]|uniref:Uncharacterized protein n=1 Tax=Candida viswanathii TaxID=5486 RepID=A0A367YGC4_9ASCO|nr:hypothetical protein Cantr_00516 [Candida viswanathii]